MPPRGTRGVAQLKKKPTSTRIQVDIAPREPAVRHSGEPQSQPDNVHTSARGTRSRPFRHALSQSLDSDDDEAENEYDAELAKGRDVHANQPSKRNTKPQPGTSRSPKKPTHYARRNGIQNSSLATASDQPETPDDYDPADIERRKAERRKVRAARAKERDAAKVEGERLPPNEGLVEEPEDSYEPKTFGRRKRY